MSACCQGSRAIRRLCFTPGPCWGNRQGQCFEYERNVDASNAFHNARSLAGHQHLDGLAAAVDDRRVLRVQHDAQTPDSAAPRDATVAEIQAEQVASMALRGVRRSRGRRRRASRRDSDRTCGRHRQSRTVVRGMPSLACNCAIVDARCDEALSAALNSSADRMTCPFVGCLNLGSAADKSVESRAGTIGHAAGVVELADMPALGAGARKSVWVRVPPPALFSLRSPACDPPTASPARADSRCESRRLRARRPQPAARRPASPRPSTPAGG